MSVILLCLAKRKLWLVELVTTTYLCLFGLALLAIHFLKVTGDVSDMQRQQVIITLLSSYGLLSHFLTPSWFFTFVTRMVLFELNFLVFMLHRTSMGDDVSFLTGFLGTQLAAILFESSLYLNTKQKLQLFVRMKKSEQQEKQLAELLDAVPDCVLICSKD